jgi:NADH-quinone oxidoreductase subunit J
VRGRSPRAGEEVSAVLLAADDVNVAQNVAFYIIAAMMLFGALRVVTSKNLVHAALWLVVVLGGVAAQYILAAAEFVAVSQVLVYIGAVMVLFLFGIMLTRAQIGSESGLNNATWAIGIPVGLVVFGLLTWVILDTVEDDVIAERAPTSTESIADEVLSPYLIPFLALSFILLAAAIGAMVLARKD